MEDIAIIDDNVSCLVIVINDEDGDLTVPIITSTDIAHKIINNCEDNSLIGIKSKIDADENGLIIKAEKISFLSHKGECKKLCVKLPIHGNKDI